MSPSVLAASIIVPTFREAPNIEPLVQRVFAAVSQAGIEAELIIVDDDSQDGTEGIVEALGAHHPVRLIVRRGQRGLAGAVLAGLNAAKYDRFVVLDADLQHPPELIPTLLARLDQNSCDFVIGSRYAGGGVIESNWPLRRRIVSRVASLLAAPLAPLSDLLSGFFALHRRTFEQAERLDPIGYKIALELYVKGRCRQPAEVPLQFAARATGESKFGFAEQMRYLRHLTRLYRFRFPWLGWVIWALALGVAASVALVGLRSSG